MKVFWTLLSLVMLPLSGFAGVNLKNGNFYISYNDLIVPGGGHDLEIVRTYNSKAYEVGWFGFGWGSDFETYLTVSADGAVVIHENGSGALTRFTPRESINPKAAAKKIIDAMRKEKPMNEDVAAKLAARLEKNVELRIAYARRHNVKAEISKGTVLYSNVRGLQEVHKKDKGWMRKFQSGRKELFNEDGKLQRIVDKNGYKINLNWVKGELKSIKDSQAKQIFFEWYQDGKNKKVKHVWSKAGKKTFYKYNGDDLIESKDVADNLFKYDYDANHNMTAINYTDGTKFKVKYDKTQFVEKITYRNGDVLQYDYGSNPKNPSKHYWTTVTNIGFNGKKRINKYEYEIKTRTDGSNYTHRIVTDINGLKTETIYTECCSLPKQITRGKHTTTFEYNKKGLLTKKTSTQGDFVQLEYDKKHNKISKVVNSKGWTVFNYDKGGNLVKANNSKGQIVILTYDRKGRIKQMIDKNAKNKKRILSFEYNALGKPVEISMSKVGKINVSYDNYGEIKKVESKAGSKMALQVTQAFQSLLAIVKPAGVNLNM